MGSPSWLSLHANILRPLLSLLLVSSSAHAFTSSAQHSQRRRLSSPIVSSALSSTESARSSGLALALDDGTRKSHSMAENTAFVGGFFRGMSSKPSFAKLTASLYFIYEAMEAAFEDENAHPAVKAMDYPSLRRKVCSSEERRALSYSVCFRNALYLTLLYFIFSSLRISWKRTSPIITVKRGAARCALRWRRSATLIAFMKSETPGHICLSRTNTRDTWAICSGGK